LDNILEIFVTVKELSESQTRRFRTINL